MFGKFVSALTFRFSSGYYVQRFFWRFNLTCRRLRAPPLQRYTVVIYEEGYRHVIPSGLSQSNHY